MRQTYTGPMMVPKHRTPDGNFKRNKIPTRASIADAAGVDREIIRRYELLAMTKVSVCMLLAGYREFDGAILDGLLAFDDVWKHHFGHERPRSLVEYLQWHRDRRIEAEIRKEEADRAAAERLARLQERAIKREQEERAKQERRAERERKQAIKREQAAKEARERAEAAALANQQAWANRTRQHELWKARKQREREKTRASRARHAAEVAERKHRAKVMADQLLSIVCAALGVDRSVVVSKSRRDMEVNARRVFVCVARDTGYCGQVPSFPTLRGLLGQLGHAAAHEAHRTGMMIPKVCSDVCAVCSALGIDPPAYAKAKAETQAA